LNRPADVVPSDTFAVAEYSGNVVGKINTPVGVTTKPNIVRESAVESDDGDAVSSDLTDFELTLSVVVDAADLVDNTTDNFGSVVDVAVVV